jgi:miniconductance mechanosensitive channel
VLLQPYLEKKAAELAEWNAGREGRAPVNLRRLTNLGTFRAYARAYLQAHPGIRDDMTLLVRQLDPGPEGLPVEIYCFTATTAWAEYEDIQSDIFDHLLAILPEFGLRAFQVPSGADLCEGLPSRGLRPL